MSRERMVMSLVELRFKHFTNPVRKTIERIVKENKCADTSEYVIDGLWSHCREDLRGVLKEFDLSCQSAMEGSENKNEKSKREVIRTYIDQALQYEADLRELDDDAFELNYREHLKPLVLENRARRVRRSEENDRWDFFNEPDAEADFGRWRDKPLSPAQAVALSLGKEPDVVTKERLDETRPVSGSVFRKKFADRLAIINGEILAGKLYFPLSIDEFAELASNRGWDLSIELTRSKNQALSEEIIRLKAINDETQACLSKLRQTIDDLPAKSVSSLYKMILGMAFRKYDHTTVGNSSATSKICSDLSLSGLKLDSETILGHLRDAAQYLDVTRQKRSSR